MGCTLCPRLCGVDRNKGERGFCSAGNKAVIGRAAPHYWEEPCISGDKGSGTVFFSGCNLKCVYCQNGKISRGAVGRELDTDQLADLYLSLQKTGVCNINFVTPTPYSDIIRSSLDIAYEKGLYLPTVYNCGGYESVEALKALSGYIGIYLPDFKYMDNELGKRYSGVPDYPQRAKLALKEMVRQRENSVYNGDGIMTKGVIVRHLVLPSHTDDSKRVLDYLYNEYGNTVTVSIMSQYTPMPNLTGELGRRLSEDEYRSVVEYALALGFKNAFIQDGESASESFIPEFCGEN